MMPQMQAQGGGAIVEYRLDRRPRRLADFFCLRRGQARCGRPDQDRGPRIRRRQDPGKRRLPGFINTRMTEDTMRRSGEAILAQAPFKRMGNPEEIAEMVVWLCSERASYVSGAAYNVDGGWMAT
jgi:Enoyl-(Acyl carrier protein) reductase